MSDLKLVDLRRYAIEQEASIIFKSEIHGRTAEVNSHGTIHFVRTEEENGRVWFNTPVEVRMEELLARAQQFLIQKVGSKPVDCSREKFAELITTKTGTKPSPEEEE